MHIRTAAFEDVPLIRKLYRDVARQGGGLARTEEEMTEDYVQEFVTRSTASGLILVVEHPEDREALIGEMHAYRPGPSVFNHVLSGLTIAIHPDFQGKKVGRTLFTIFLEQIGINRPDIGKVELI